MASPAIPGTPTRTRYRVMVFGFAMSMITYLDRVCIAAAAPAMTADVGLTDYQMGAAFSAFALAYGIFEVPTGWLGDRIGQRAMLTRIVACWSVFTALTGAVRGWGSLVAVRFLFGAAEAGAFPNLARALSRWFPRSSRAAVNGAMWMGARLGGAVAPAIAVALIASLGWRATFAIFGAVGTVWCVAFFRWYTDDPEDHKSVNAAELELIRRDAPPAAHPAAAPWRRIWSSGNVWALFWMYFMASFGFQFLVTWLPTYLVREHGLTLARTGAYAALPMAAAAAGCLAGGSLSDWLARRTGNVRTGRAVVGAGGFLLGAAGFAAAAGSAGPLAAMLWLAGAQFALDSTVGVSWATCVDIGGHFGGTLAGFMNMASSVAAVLFPMVAAALEDRFGSFQAVFTVAAGGYLAGGLLWLRIDPRRSLT